MAEDEPDNPIYRVTTEKAVLQAVQAPAGSELQYILDRLDTIQRQTEVRIPRRYGQTVPPVPEIDIELGRGYVILIDPKDTPLEDICNGLAEALGEPVLQTTRLPKRKLAVQIRTRKPYILVRNRVGRALTALHASLLRIDKE